MRKVVGLAESDERRHCRAMGKSQRRLEQEISRLEELKAYRQSYFKDLAPKSGLSTTRWQDYQNFLRRLDHAVGAQEQLVKDGERNRDAHRRRWLEKKQRLDSLESVVDRYRRADELERDRHAQKMLDDRPHSHGDLDQE